MIASMKRVASTLAVSIATCGTAVAAPSPFGIWMDHTGRERSRSRTATGSSPRPTLKSEMQA